MEFSEKLRKAKEMGCVTYHNSLSEAKKVGWHQLPEFCIGDIDNAKLVTHDHLNGVFLFHN